MLYIYILFEVFTEFYDDTTKFGALAQMVARLIRIQEVTGSIPVGSKFLHLRVRWITRVPFFFQFFFTIPISMDFIMSSFCIRQRKFGKDMSPWSVGRKVISKIPGFIAEIGKSNINREWLPMVVRPGCRIRFVTLLFSASIMLWR